MMGLPDRMHAYRSIDISQIVLHVVFLHFNPFFALISVSYMQVDK